MNKKSKYEYKTKIYEIQKLWTGDWWASCNYGPSFNCGKRKPKIKMGDIVVARVEVMRA